MLVAARAVVQQPLGELLAVELGKQVLVVDVGEQLDHLVERLLDGLVAQLLGAALQ